MLNNTFTERNIKGDEKFLSFFPEKILGGVDIDKICSFMERNSSFIAEMLSVEDHKVPSIIEVFVAIHFEIPDEFIIYVFKNSKNVLMMQSIYHLLMEECITSKEEIDELLKMDSDYHLVEIEYASRGYYDLRSESRKKEIEYLKKDYKEKGEFGQRLEDMKWKYKNGHLYVDILNK